METTRAVNLRFEDFDVYVGRKGHGYLGYYGNPFPRMGGRGEALRLFVPWFAKRVLDDAEFMIRVLELRGLRLGCFCKPWNDCHADVYVDYIENFPKEWADALIAEWRRDHPRPASWMSDLARRIPRQKEAL